MSENDVKKCPFCAEDIKKEAIVCRFCNRELSAQKIDVPPAQPQLAPSYGYICEHCGKLGYPRKVVPGSFVIEVLLWLLFLVPGIIYTVWRLTAKYQACPHCLHAGSMVNVHTPRGTLLFQQFSSENINQQPEDKTKKPASTYVIVGGACLFFIIIIIGIASKKPSSPPSHVSTKNGAVSGLEGNTFSKNPRDAKSGESPRVEKTEANRRIVTAANSSEKAGSELKKEIAEESPENQGSSRRVPNYAILNEDVGDTPIKTQVTMNVLATGHVDEAELRLLLENLYASVKARTGFKYHSAPTNIYIYIFTDKVKAQSGMGEWVAMLSKSLSDPSPTISVSQYQIDIQPNTLESTNSETDEPMTGEQTTEEPSGGTEEYNNKLVEVFRRLGESGHPEACVRLGNIFSEGKIAPENNEEAIKYHLIAAKNGIVKSQLALGSLYKSERKYKEAMKWFLAVDQQEASDNVPFDFTRPTAQFEISVMYKNGEGVKKSLKEASMWYRKSVITQKANMDRVVSQSFAKSTPGKTEEPGSGKGHEPNAYRLALISEILMLAKQGYNQAKMDLAEQYFAPFQDNINLDEAIKWYLSAAKQGNLKAQIKLGELYRIKKKYTDSMKWYLKAAEQGSPEAQSSLFSIYFSGEGVPEDYVKAVEWERKSAAQGNAQAQFEMGQRYMYGEGVPRDYGKALEWYKQACENGWESACLELGLMYRDGNGVTKNGSEAVNWFLKACSQGGGTGEEQLKKLHLLQLNENTPEIAAIRTVQVKGAVAAKSLDSLLTIAKMTTENDNESMKRLVSQGGVKILKRGEPAYVEREGTFFGVEVVQVFFDRHEEKWWVVSGFLSDRNY